MIPSLGASRLPLGADAPREERLRRTREMLAHALTQGGAVAVVGSGCSAPLGYPTWERFSGEVIDLTLRAFEAPGASESVKARIERVRRFQARLLAHEPLASHELMFSIGACKRLLAGRKETELAYRELIEQLFRPPERLREGAPNPFLPLLKLPITRFVTTNYDCEVEIALGGELGFDRSEWLASRRGPGSFTQGDRNCDQLARFALAHPAVRDDKTVFHCHGRYDDPESIIATESDYQAWYLKNPESMFLQTFDLLFSSNPILFVGYGLRDEDLLRPLRRIGAAAPERREVRPLFALLPEPAEASDWDFHEHLFERYGLNVLPFVAPTRPPDPERSGTSLCDQLEQLEANRLEWRDAWLSKPYFRRVTVHAKPPRPYRHYGIDQEQEEVLGVGRVEEELNQLKELALGDSRVIVLVGPGGTGKSWHAMRLLEILEKERAFDGYFFWSSYYADDSLTGLDRLLGYVDAHGDRRESRFKRLRQSLHQGHYAVVFDGFERLLRPTGDPDAGASNDPVVRRFLEICADPKSRSTLILTSRLWPADLPRNAKGIASQSLDRMRTADLLSVAPFSSRDLDREVVSSLCSLLEGHAYACMLAARFLVTSPTGLAASLVSLQRRLASESPDRRLGRMIEIALQDLDGRLDGLARPLLSRLAVFMSPVTENTIELCFRLARESVVPRTAEPPSLDRVLAELLAGRLIFRVVAGAEEGDPPAYTVHPTVRSFVFEPTQQVERDVLPNFTLAGFTSGKAPVYPGSRETANLVRGLFSRLYDEATRALDQGHPHTAGELCRSLFGVVRSRMEANTAPRWCPYPEYLRFGYQIADLARRQPTRRWTFREAHELDEMDAPEAPLYADELAFVYNDLGLALCAEGSMRDTLDIWQQGYEINRILEGTAEVPLYTLQSQLHLGHTFIEIGDLKIASHYLEETARTNFQVRDADYAARILGYQALVAHYRNQLEESERMFEVALKELRASGGNPRAESYFLSLRAKNAIAREDFTQAGEAVRSSRALAQLGGAADLVGYARTAAGRLLREQGRFPEANAEYQAALAISQELGIRRLEAEVQSGLSRTALLLGDAELARRRAMAALGIANELGLGLRMTQGLMALGLATLAMGQIEQGRAYLRLARDLSDRQEYRLRSREAEGQLLKFGDEGTASGDSIRPFT